MNISVVNHTNGEVQDSELQTVIRAINRQINEDFYQQCGMHARLRLKGRSVEEPGLAQTADLRGDAIIYLSHEALELIADPETNLLVMGPHPNKPKQDVLHWFEMCDAVQNERYDIDGVEVSNFVPPLYFTGTRKTDEVGARNDFPGTIHKNQTLKSFGINPGGFCDPVLQDHDTYAIKGDRVAGKRLQRKARAKQTRRAMRYRTFAARIGARAGRRAAAKEDGREFEEIGGMKQTAAHRMPGRHRPSTTWAEQT